MKILKAILLVLFLGFIVIQFIPVEKNIDNSSAAGAAFFEMYNVSPEVQETLRTSCLDCHSNNTNYLWYHKIQPSTWYIQSHVNEGKSELNFDEFNTYSAKKRKHKLEESIEMVEDGEMPLSSYTLLHQNAKLDETEQRQLISSFNKLLTEKPE